MVQLSLGKWGDCEIEGGISQGGSPPCEVGGGRQEVSEGGMGGMGGNGDEVMR